MGGGAVNYGYCYIKGELRLEQVPDEIRWVSKMFEWLVIDNVSVYGIARKLNEQAVPTKQNGHKWSPTTVRDILRNPVYIGRWYWRKTESCEPENPRDANRKHIKSSRKNRDRAEWIEVAVPAAVPEELFEAAQAKLNVNVDRAISNCKAEYLLKGLLQCSYCGKPLRGQLQRGHRYYTCTGKDNRRTPDVPKCTSTAYRADDLEAEVWSKLEQYLTNPHLIEDTVAARETHHSAEIERYETDMLSLKELEQRIEAKIRRWDAAYEEGVLTASDYKEKTAPLRKQLADNRTEATKVQDQIAKRSVSEYSPELLRELCTAVQQGIELFNDEDKRTVYKLLELQVVVSAEGVRLEGVLTSELTGFCDRRREADACTVTGKEEALGHETEGLDCVRASPASGTPREAITHAGEDLHIPFLLCPSTGPI